MSTATPDPTLKNLVRLPEVAAPAPVKIDGVPSKLERVTRPLRHVRYIPTKQLVFYSKHKVPQFTYDIKYKIPIKSHQIVIQVKATGLNPVDLKIINSYTSNLNRERGIGREYSGVITHVGDKYKTEWKEGDEVSGLYFHPNGYGTLASSIIIDPTVDAIVKKPSSISFEAAGSWLITFGAAWQILKQTKINSESSVLVNGGSSSVALMLIQILKTEYKVENITAIASPTAKSLVQEAGAKLVINYKVNAEIPKVLTLLTKTGVYKDFDEDGNAIELREIPASKFDLIVDFVGGYDLVAKSGSYLKPSSESGKYITTVGDQKFNYKQDIYNDWNSTSANARKLFGGLWSMNYQKFYFNHQPSDWLEIGAERLESGEIKNYIDTIYNWKDYGKAALKLKNGRAHGKIVLQVDDF